MLIDLITEKNNFIFLSYFDNASDDLKKHYYNVKADLTWKIERSLPEFYLLFNSIFPFKIQTIDFSFTCDSVLYYFFVSNDGVLWNELQWKTYNNLYYKLLDEYVLYFLTDPSKIDKEENRTFIEKTDFVSLSRTDIKIMFLGNKNFDQDFVFRRYIKYYDKDFKFFDILNEKNQMMDLYNQGISPPTIISSTEIFQVQRFGKYVFIDGNGNYLYSFQPCMLKILFQDLTASKISPFTLDQLVITADEEYSQNIPMLSIIKQNFFNQKYFEEMPFLPSQIQSFLEMLEFDYQNIKKLDVPNGSKIELELIQNGIGYGAINSTFIIG